MAFVFPPRPVPKYSSIKAEKKCTLKKPQELQEYRINFP